MSSTAAVQPVLLTISDFCKRQQISQTTYCRLKKRGLGPREIDLGSNVIRIRPEDEAAWQHARAFPDATEAAEIANRAEARRSKGRWSASSKKHVSQRKP